MHGDMQPWLKRAVTNGAIVFAIHTCAALVAYALIARVRRAHPDDDLLGLAWMPLQLLDLPGVGCGNLLLYNVPFFQVPGNDLATLIIVGIFGGIWWFLLGLTGSLFRHVVTTRIGKPGALLLLLAGGITSR